jgi:hypothetical protein
VERQTDQVISDPFGDRAIVPIVFEPSLKERIEK